MDKNFALWLDYSEKIIFPSIGATLRMTFISMFFACIFGMILAIFLVLYGPHCNLNPKPKVYKILDFFVNMIRSFPIIILIVAISPLTKLLVGTTLGEKAAIFPLTISAIPFVARVIENALNEVDKQLIEVGKSFGASNMQIILLYMVKEAVPAITLGITLCSISFLTATTLAGAVGAGGLGAVALNYGYQSFNNFILYFTVFIILILVQIFQVSGDLIYKKLK
jgi:D-methionine transport system permease protein